MPITKENKAERDGEGNLKHGKRRPYTPPRVLSAERLEAAAATCEPAAPPYGKTLGPFDCATLGS